MGEKAIWPDIPRVCGHIFTTRRRVKIQHKNHDEQKAKLEADLQDHLKLADEGYASLRKDCEKCKESWS